MSTIPNSSKTCGRRTKRESRTCLPGQLFLLDLCASGHFCFPFLLVVFVVRPHRPTVCPWCRTTYQRCCICSTTTLYIQGIHHVKQQQQGYVSGQKEVPRQKRRKTFHKNKDVQQQQQQQQDIQQQTRVVPATEAGAVALDPAQFVRRTYMGVPRVISFW